LGVQISGGCWLVVASCDFMQCDLLFLLKLLNFKFKYFYSSQNSNGGTSLLPYHMASNNKGGAHSMHQLVTLKIKQLAIIIEIFVICLNPSNEFPTKSLSVNSTKEVVEVLDQNLLPPKINKTRAYESKKKFQVS